MLVFLRQKPHPQSALWWHAREDWQPHSARLKLGVQIINIAERTREKEVLADVSKREVEEAYRISLKSLARRYLELHDEIADLDDMMEAIVKDLAPELLEQTAIGLNSAAQTDQSNTNRRLTLRRASKDRSSRDRPGSRR